MKLFWNIAIAIVLVLSTLFVGQMILGNFSEIVYVEELTWEWNSSEDVDVLWVDFVHSVCLWSCIGALIFQLGTIVIAFVTSHLSSLKKRMQYKIFFVVSIIAALILCILPFIFFKRPDYDLGILFTLCAVHIIVYPAAFFLSNLRAPDAYSGSYRLFSQKKNQD